jgi:hypothetical protein
MQQTASSRRLGGQYHTDSLTPTRSPSGGVPELRMVVVAGAPHRPGQPPTHDGMEIRAFVLSSTWQPAARDLAATDGTSGPPGSSPNLCEGLSRNSAPTSHPCRRRFLGPCAERLKPLQTGRRNPRWLTYSFLRRAGLSVT